MPVGRVMAVKFWLGLAAAGISACTAVALPSGGIRATRCAVEPGIAFVPAGNMPLGEDGAQHPGTSTYVDAFRMDRTEVTNGQFAAFVAATGYVTEAETQGAAAVFIQAVELENGLEDPRAWWRLVRGANWRHPQGDESNIRGLSNRPVVQITYADAMAYARWRGGTLPTELQWERAARGKQTGTRDPHGWQKDEADNAAANVWDGIFPIVNTKEDGFTGIAPVGCYAPNDFGLYDMIGNVWEWTRNAEGNAGSLRGGSFLCSRNYCANYRPVGLQVQEADLGTSHAGFRVVYAER